MVGFQYEVMKKLGKHLSLRLFYIPPHSLAIIRGDLLHAGAGGIEARGTKAPRFHLYIMRSGIALGDSINDAVGRCFKLKEADKQDDWKKHVRDL